MAISFTLNGKAVSYDGDPEKPLLWVIREDMALTGTKFGCGIAMCGACTAYIDGQPQRTCVTPVSGAEGADITTIEALETPEGRAIQQAWLELEVVQCGFCQSGQIMSAAALLEQTPKPTDADIDSALSGNLCRCNTYHRIRAGIHRAADILEG